jgi:hypothetical protein
MGLLRQKRISSDVLQARQVKQVALLNGYAAVQITL